MIDTVLDPDHRELLELCESILDRSCTIEHLRALLDRGEAHSSELWATLADAGLVSALIDDAHGGLGLDPAFLSGVLFALGRHAVPEPFLETAVVAASVLGDSDWADAGAWLERIAAGDAMVAVRLDGAAHVAFATDADLLIEIDADDAVRAFTADQLTVADAAALDPLRPLSTVQTGGTGIDLAVPVERVRRARALAVAGAACLLAGASRRLLDLTVEYVGMRKQFDRPVGSFQAVKHKIADVAVRVDMATSAALSAFDGVDGPDAVRRAAAAKAYAGDAGHAANVQSLQLHGGIGFTWEYELQIWLKRVMSLSAAYGTTRQLRRELARQLLAELDEA
ncbi:acyl-CoA dehydrogenase family protein [Microbacterium sp. NPDC055357]